MAGTTISGCSTSRCSLRSPEMLSVRTRVAFPLALLLIGGASGSCYADSSSFSFGFNIHHRFSDPVRSIFPAGEDEYLPEIGTVGYFAAMAERDRVHGRHLAASTTHSSPLTFVAGNATYLTAKPLGWEGESGTVGVMDDLWRAGD